MTINIFQKAGAFAEDKDVAKEIRTKEIIPVLKKNRKVTLNFAGVETATQSFIHALISDLLRIYGTDVLDKIEFESCNEVVKKMINIVAEYMQASIGTD